jgi:uncharacterized protein DUF551
MKWISISDKLPEVGKLILVFDDLEKEIRFQLMEADNQFYYYNYSFGEEYAYEPGRITHWMPLPNQPERLSEKTPKDDATV